MPALTVRLFFLAAVATTLVSGCGSRPEPGIAVVNGRTITRQEFYNYLQRKPSVTVVVNDVRGTMDARVASTLGFQALNDLVNRQLLEEIGRKQGISPTEADIDKEIEFREDGDKGFVSRLKKQGLTEEDIRKDIEMDLIQERLWSQGIKVSEADVDAYIASHPEEFGEPATADLRWIVVTSDQKRLDADHKIKAGASFENVAKQLSEVPGVAENRAVFPERRLDRVPLQVRKLIEQTKPGESTPWFRDGARQVKVFVVSKNPGKRVKPDAHTREQVRRTIAIQKGRSKNELSEMLRDAMRNAKVSVNDTHLDGLWRAAEKASLNDGRP
jgi:parvulin-like peptidyl-prolyl isomerase